MSYDISFKVKVEGKNKYIEIGYGDTNITWNVREIIVRSTGLEWKNEANNGLCSEVMPHIYDGYAELGKHPSKYVQYEAENGWGTVKGTKHFFLEIIKDWERLLFDDPELASVATFWIE